MVIGILKIEIYMEGNRSLKEKRKIIKSLLGKIRSRFINISVSEVGSQDIWKHALLGFTLAGNDTPFVNSLLDQLQTYIKENGFFHIVSSEIEIINF